MYKALITDFDGTLVDTFEANYFAYKKAFSKVHLDLTQEVYRKCFGYRFDKFMNTLNIHDNELRSKIREYKKEYYPEYFDYLLPNNALINLIYTFKKQGLKTAIASTARRENLEAALQHLSIKNLFDIIYTGEDVKNGKPSPEIYNLTIKELNVNANETIIFEDSEVGVKAAIASGAHCIKIIL